MLNHRHDPKMERLLAAIPSERISDDFKNRLLSSDTVLLNIEARVRKTQQKEAPAVKRRTSNSHSRVVCEFTTDDLLNPDFDPVPEPTRGEMAMGIMAVPVVLFLIMLAGLITR